MSETWWEYVRRISRGGTQRDIAAIVGVDSSRITGWKQGDIPRAENVVAFARAYKRSPLEALIAARYINAADVDTAVEVTASAAELHSDDLLEEVRRRMKDPQPRSIGAGVGTNDPRMNRAQNSQ